jgi:hypothetical protein
VAKMRGKSFEEPYLFLPRQGIGFPCIISRL